MARRPAIVPIVSDNADRLILGLLYAALGVLISWMVAIELFRWIVG